MRLRILMLLTLTILYSFPLLANAATYNWYFSDDAAGNAVGNDRTGDGSIGNPWKTLNKAQTEIDAVTSADTVNLYFDRGDTWADDTAAVAQVNIYGLLIGSDDPAVNIDAYGSGSNPIFDGQVTDFKRVPVHNATTGPYQWNRIFEFKRNNCSVKNFMIKQCYGNAIYLNNADDFILQYCTLYSLGASGINQSQAYNIENITIANNTIHTAQQLYRYSKRPGWGGAIGLGKSISGPGAIGHVIRHNLIYDVYGEGIIGPGSIVEYNVVGDTWSYAIHVAPFDYDGHDIIVRYNIVIGSNSATYKLGRENGSGIVHFDETYGVGSNAEADIEIYGNIVINRGFGIRVYDMDGDKSIKVFNNLCIDNGYNYYFDDPGDATNGYVYNNSSILYDRVDKVHTAKSITFPRANWTIENNHFWTTGGSPTVDDGWTTNYVIADPKLPGEPAIDWDGQSGATYYKDIDFNTHLYPSADSVLINAGKILGVGYENMFLTTGTDFNTLPFTIQRTSQPVESNWTIGAIVRRGSGTPLEPPTDQTPLEPPTDLNILK
ncbi:MAG: right-handed parallel beta-helix repeat-containing protein [Bacteroidales bacterium]|nr:right-handed parallel beta-helix repeat-containing protein [Bacteroidales bacterium]